ncbi:MAG TPA: PadR family transcriptional regulator, partial [Ktedonobacterales bacterium]|nr:PadR family transcriptional regulator [Ktedonobacterales bacterium]
MPRSLESAETTEIMELDGSSVATAASGRGTLHYIILGLLGAHPMSGYDIKRAFDRSLATYWNAGNSQIYTTLKTLAARKL